MECRKGAQSAFPRPWSSTRPLVAVLGVDAVNRRFKGMKALNRWGVVARAYRHAFAVVRAH